MTPTALRVCVTDKVKIREFAAPVAVTEAISSPFFQPTLAFSIDDGVEYVQGNPRGPTIKINFDLIEVATL